MRVLNETERKTLAELLAVHSSSLIQMADTLGVDRDEFLSYISQIELMKSITVSHKHYRFSEGEQTIQSLQKQNKSQEYEIKNLISKIDKQTDYIHELEDKIGELNDTIYSLEADNRSLSAKIEKLKEKLEVEREIKFSSGYFLGAYKMKDRLIEGHSQPDCFTGNEIISIRRTQLIDLFNDVTTKSKPKTNFDKVKQKILNMDIDEFISGCDDFFVPCENIGYPCVNETECCDCKTCVKHYLSQKVETE